MDRILTTRVLLGLIVIFLLIITALLISNRNQPAPAVQNVQPTPTSQPQAPTSTPIAPPQTTSPTTGPTPPTVSRVNIYLIAINDDGKSGTRIGCGDSLVAVQRNITPTAAPLRAAYEELLSIKTQYFGQSGLYNSLYQSNLRVDNVVIDNNGKATVNLTGTVRLGGTCDNPRFQSQLTQTALQFPTVKQVSISINGTPLDQIVSQR